MVRRADRPPPHPALNVAAPALYAAVAAGAGVYQAAAVADPDCTATELWDEAWGHGDMEHHGALRRAKQVAIAAALATGLFVAVVRGRAWQAQRDAAQPPPP